MRMTSLKRSLLVLLAMVVMFSFSAMTVFAESGSPGGGGDEAEAASVTKTVFNYSTKTDGTATMNKAVKHKNYKSCTVYGIVKHKNVTYKVTVIKKTAFKALKKVKTIRFDAESKNVQKIEKGAFSGCKKLKTIKISKKMSNKDFKRLKKLIRKAGFKGKITRY